MEQGDEHHTVEPVTLRDAALAAHQAGLCVVPPRQDGSKRPEGSWKNYQTTRPTPEQLDAWYRPGGSRTGLGVICGAISGGLEMLELEGRAVEAGLNQQLIDACDTAGIGELLERIVAGYCERTPTGGVHLLYRCATAEGNTRLAANDRGEVLAETRGEGGYVIVAPTTGPVHPSGNAYELVTGSFSSIAIITPAERAALHNVVRSFDQTRPELHHPPPVASLDEHRERTGSWIDEVATDFNRRTTWIDLLAGVAEPHHTDHAGVTHWHRIGSQHPTGATTNATTAPDRLCVHSTSWPIPVECSPATYDRFSYEVVRRTGRDDRTARVEVARRLRADGYGPPLPPSPPQRQANDDPWPDDNDAPPTDDQTVTTTEALALESIDDLLSRVAAMPEPSWLAQPIWPADAYGVLGAERKAGKTWLVLDLAISKATGTKWLDCWETTPGPVVAFLGEGGARKMTRRMQAVARHKGVDLRGIPLTISLKPPKLTKAEALANIHNHLAEHPADLVIIDPWYLSAPGADMAKLVSVGEVLAGIQQVCQSRGAALVIVHHWNKTGTGTGADRFSGTGLAEWGRILMAMSVVTRTTANDHPGGSDVTLKIETIGDEIGDTETTFRRTVWADDPDSLTSPMHYTIEVLPDVVDSKGDRPASHQRVLNVIQSEPGRTWTVKTIGDDLADTGHPLKQRTIQDALKALVDAGLVDPGSTLKGVPGTWRAAVRNHS